MAEPHLELPPAAPALRPPPALPPAPSALPWQAPLGLYPAPAWPPQPPRLPRIGPSILLVIGSLLIAPLLPACWWLGHTEIRGMADGSVANVSRGWFDFVRLWGMIWTFLLPVVLAAVVSRT